MMMLVADNTPEQVAWKAFDAAALEFQAMYARVDGEPEVAAATASDRYAKASEVVRLWETWRALFAAGDDPRPAA